MALFNYIYKNDILIQSLYAQIFSGLLECTEIRESAKSSASRSREVKIPPIVKGNLIDSDTNEKMKSNKMSPHDAMLSDILITLKPSMKDKLVDARFGDIIHLQGELLIIPSEIEINGIEVIFEAFASQIPLQGIPKQARTSVKNFLKKSFVSTENGVRFLFRVKGGGILRGVLQADNLQESQKALTFKHGFRLIPSEIVAVYEEGDDIENTFLPGTCILGGLHELSGMVNTVYLSGLPPTSPVTPITIFYRLNGTDSLPSMPQ